MPIEQSLHPGVHNFTLSLMTIDETVCVGLLFRAAWYGLLCHKVMDIFDPRLSSVNT